MKLYINLSAPIQIRSRSLSLWQAHRVFVGLMTLVAGYQKLLKDRTGYCLL